MPGKHREMGEGVSQLNIPFPGLTPDFDIQSNPISVPTGQDPNNKEGATPVKTESRS